MGANFLFLKMPSHTVPVGLRSQCCPRNSRKEFLAYPLYLVPAHVVEFTKIKVNCAGRWGASFSMFFSALTRVPDRHILDFGVTPAAQEMVVPMISEIGSAASFMLAARTNS